MVVGVAAVAAGKRRMTMKGGMSVLNGGWMNITNIAISFGLLERDISAHAEIERVIASRSAMETEISRIHKNRLDIIGTTFLGTLGRVVVSQPMIGA